VKFIAPTWLLLLLLLRQEMHAISVDGSETVTAIPRRCSED
jgi:hypothetical protein